MNTSRCLLDSKRQVRSRVAVHCLACGRLSLALLSGLAMALTGHQRWRSRRTEPTIEFAAWCRSTLLKDAAGEIREARYSLVTAIVGGVRCKALQSRVYQRFRMSLHNVQCPGCSGAASRMLSAGRPCADVGPISAEPRREPMLQHAFVWRASAFAFGPLPLA